MLKHEKVTLERIRNTFKNRIKPLIYSQAVPVEVASWTVHGEPVSPAQAMIQKYEPHKLGQHWGSQWDTTWFHVKGEVPADWKGKHVDLMFNLGHSGWEGFTIEAQVFTPEGTPITAINGNRNDIPVAKVARGGEKVEVYIEAGYNHRDREGSIPWDTTKHYEGKSLYSITQAELAIFEPSVWAFYHDFWAAFETAENLVGETPRKGNLIYTLNQVVNLLDLRGRDGIEEASALLKPLLACTNGSSAHQISAVGHAHIDTAWLWPLRESMRKCARTFSTALEYMKDYPNYVFVCSQAIHYAWMKAKYPAIYAGMKEAFKRGQWEPVGSMWIEPDCNVPNGESLVRQILHAKRFWMQEFGYETKDVWIPDVFGYAASMPQIMKKSGVDYFITQKISWSQFNRFPHHTFNWEGIDGTKIFTHFPPADTYNAEMKPHELVKTEKSFLEHGRANRSLMIYGYGDGGGGPTKSMLELAKRFEDFEGLPKLKQERLADFLPKAEKDAKDLPVWMGELYLELHRGTYTTQARTKRGNRKGEQSLREAEFFDTLDFALNGAGSGKSISALAPDRAVYDVYVRDDAEVRRGHTGALDRAWKLLLLNQFHDILPGSSIAWVYQDNQKDCSVIQTLAAQVREDSAQPLVTRINTGAADKPLAVFNSLGFDRFEVVDGPTGTPFFVEAPSLGYIVIDEATAGTVPEGLIEVETSKVDGNIILENGLIRVTIDKDGLLSSVFDLWNEREVIAPGKKGNVFQIHPDYPNNWNAWDVDVFYKEVVEDITAVDKVELIESTTLRATVLIERSFGKSKLSQKLILRAGTSRIDFETHADWHECCRFLKVAFPVDIHSPRATYEIQYGNLERPTHSNTSWDMARFEVAAQKWADLSEGDYGVALLNDCKYGHDIWGNTLRLSLLRGSTDPDPVADQGEHDFTYSLFPHEGDFREGGVIEEAHALNLPLRVISLPQQPTGNLPSEQSWFETDKSGVYIEAVKVSEDGDTVIVRLYEGWGTRGECAIATQLPVKSVTHADMLERSVGAPLPMTDGVVVLNVKPYEIITLKYQL
ncbi:MAG: alpha-mannosidase [Verrucomicrobiota bacterium]|nr:alpha-mannosidase [Verrucomicrobiota bacterium]